jgi:hypothetical protein
MPVDILIIAAASLTAVIVAAHALLKGWNGWLALKRLELERTAPEGPLRGSPGPIELADMRERLRQLEAIAAGVDL